MLLGYIITLGYCVKLLGIGYCARLLGCCNAGCYISWYTAYSTAKVAAKTAANGVLPEDGWVLGAVNKLVYLALSKEVVLGIDLRAVECLMRCNLYIF